MSDEIIAAKCCGVSSVRRRVRGLWPEVAFLCLFEAPKTAALGNRFAKIGGRLRLINTTEKRVRRDRFEHKLLLLSRGTRPFISHLSRIARCMIKACAFNIAINKSHITGINTEPIVVPTTDFIRVERNAD